MPKNKNYPNKLLWVDLEFTGLNPKLDRILEIGLIISDFKFKELATYEAVILQPDKILDRMRKAPFYEYKNGRRRVIKSVYDVAKKNGLIEKIKSEGQDERAVEKRVCELVDKHFDGLAVLAGNSIHVDRRMIRQWWPDLERRLHYRMLDVSSFKVLMQGLYGLEHRNPHDHRALEDIRGSMAELKYYLKLLKDPKLKEV